MLESAYEGAFCVELAKAGISYERQKVYPLYYKGEIYWRKTPSFSSQKSTYVDFYMGHYIADLVIDNKISKYSLNPSIIQRV